MSGYWKFFGCLVWDVTDMFETLWLFANFKTYYNVVDATVTSESLKIIWGPCLACGTCTFGYLRTLIEFFYIRLLPFSPTQSQISGRPPCFPDFLSTQGSPGRTAVTCSRLRGKKQKTSWTHILHVTRSQTDNKPMLWQHNSNKKHEQQMTTGNQGEIWERTTSAIQIISIRTPGQFCFPPRYDHIDSCPWDLGIYKKIWGACCFGRVATV